MATTTMSTPISTLAGQGIKLERTLLSAQIADILRERLVSGQFAPGIPLVEREIAEQLGVSRVPVRDALMLLQSEGLVENKPNGRCVIELTERDIRELYQVRLALEKLAVRLAAQNICSEHSAALQRELEAMKLALANHDPVAFHTSDLETHRLIWQQSGNLHLLSTFASMVGPILMLVARISPHYDWRETLHLHEDLIGRILAGDAEGAEASIEPHLENSQQRSLELFAKGLL